MRSMYDLSMAIGFYGMLILSFAFGTLLLIKLFIVPRFKKPKKEKSMYLPDVLKHTNKIKIFHSDRDTFMSKDNYEDESRYHGNIIIPRSEGRREDKYAQWINHDGEHYCCLSHRKFKWFCQIVKPENHIYEYDKDFERTKAQFMRELNNCHSKRDWIKTLGKFYTR